MGNNAIFGFMVRQLVGLSINRYHSYLIALQAVALSSKFTIIRFATTRVRKQKKNI